MSRAQILRHRPLRALLAAEVISSTGTQMTWLALPWFVLVTSGSAARMTIVMAVELLGFAAASLPSGPLVHRLGARRTMLLADAARAPLMLLVPVLHWSGHLTYAPLVVLALLLGMLGAPFFTAQRVILPELLGEDERTVGQANALFQGAIRTTLLLGPPLAGVLIGVFGADNGARHRRGHVPRVVPARRPVRSVDGACAPDGGIARNPVGLSLHRARSAPARVDAAVPRRRCGLAGVLRRGAGARRRALRRGREDRGAALRARSAPAPSAATSSRSASSRSGSTACASSRCRSRSRPRRCGC